MRRNKTLNVTRAEADVLEHVRQLEQRGGEITTADVAKSMRKQVPVGVEHLLNLKAKGRITESRSPSDAMLRIWKRS
jgi:Mn-dependent DtxR family transcriptional regulator